MEDRLAAWRDVVPPRYMAEWTETEDGWLLIENHCPICAAAAECQNFCRSELDIFRRVLGPSVTVERVDHVWQAPGAHTQFAPSSHEPATCETLAF